jgi:hypothetical protein
MTSSTVQRWFGLISGSSSLRVDVEVGAHPVPVDLPRAQDPTQMLTM